MPSVSAKKKSLRKFQLVSGLAAFVVVVAGVATASVLSQRSADDRSSADEGNPTNRQIAPDCSVQKVGQLWVRQLPKNGTWSEWQLNMAMDGVGGIGQLTGFGMYTPLYGGAVGYGADQKQYAVKNGALWVRTGGLDQKWSEWSSNTAMDTTGTGVLTSFNAYSDTITKTQAGKSFMKQFAVKGGQLWTRTSADGTNWTGWAGPNKAVDGVGTGTLTSFSATLEPGLIKQYAVKGGQLWVRTSTDGLKWSSWAGPNTAVSTIGGTLTAFGTSAQLDASLKQYATTEIEVTIGNCQ